MTIEAVSLRCTHPVLVGMTAPCRPKTAPCRPDADRCQPDANRGSFEGCHNSGLRLWTAIDARVRRKTPGEAFVFSGGVVAP
jgi:hypothetical protein